MKLSDLEKKILQQRKHSFILGHLKNKMDSAPTMHQRKYKVHGMTFDELFKLNSTLRKSDFTELSFKDYVKSLDNVFIITPAGRWYLRKIQR